MEELAIRKPASLKGTTFLQRPGLRRFFKAVRDKKGEARIVGGAVRNQLLGVAVADVDIATNLTPQLIMTIGADNGFGVHPIGLAHGTILLIDNAEHYEVTSLRRDIQTDGRHAVVEFTDNWQEDALRRDFTINALFCDDAGNIYDYTNGYNDILKGNVRFVGDPCQRIKEDYLRILRFFRFSAHYGKSRLDRPGLVACIMEQAGLAQLSAERLCQELLKLLCAPRAVRILKIMAKFGILQNILAHDHHWRFVQRLSVDQPLLRLYALSVDPLETAARLRLSKQQINDFKALRAAPPVHPDLTQAHQHAILYRLGARLWRQHIALCYACSEDPVWGDAWRDLLALGEKWPIPTFPVNGDDLKAAGFQIGPKMGVILKKLEEIWIASDFGLSKEQLRAHAISML